MGKICFSTLNIFCPFSPQTTLWDKKYYPKFIVDSLSNFLVSKAHTCNEHLWWARDLSLFFVLQADI